MTSLERWTAIAGIVLFAAAILPACSDDNPTSPPPPPGGRWVETTIESWNYLDNRFFRLDLPPFENPEQFGYAQADEPGRTEGERIDIASIRVYRNLGNAPAQLGDVVYAAATIDTTGRWDDEGYISSISDPGSLSSWVPAWTWRPLDLRFQLDPTMGSLIAVDLGQEMNATDILGVVYNVVDDQGNLLFTVGDHPDMAGSVRGLDINGQGYYRFKLLKPESRAPFSYQYVLRNIYDLGLRQVDPTTATMTIEANREAEPQDQHGAFQTPYLQIYGLDRESSDGTPGADGTFDWHRQDIFDLYAGLLRFPLDFPFPFAATEAQYRRHAYNSGAVQFDWEGTWLADHLSPEIYDWRTNPAHYSQSNHFRFVIRHWVVDPEQVTAPGVITLDREDWCPASLPAGVTFGTDGRANDMRWYSPVDRVTRRLLDPNLSGPARDETVTTLELAVNPINADWDWAGIMTGFPVVLPTDQVSELVIWVNDFQQEPAHRSGILRVELGTIDEDFQWRDVSGELSYGTISNEDRNLDGVFTVIAEDVGLDAVIDQNNDVVQEGLIYQADRTIPGVPGWYPRLNRTARNGRLDSEDVNGDTRFNRENRYRSWSIDLAGDDAVTDVVQEHPEADLAGSAWREYALTLDEGEPVGMGGDALEWVQHLRIWIENTDGSEYRRYQIARLTFR